jgi:hypothetical protein
MRIALIAGALLLNGCAIGYNKAMTADMRALDGKPISQVIDRLGYPGRDMVIAGDKVYVWEDNGCTLKVGVDKADRVSHAEFDGDHSDCKPYKRKLETT